jgi:predicted DNA-binding protein (MmcQ/YjbR family)
MTEDKLHEYLLSFPDTWQEFPYGENLGVYKYGDQAAGTGAIYALIEQGSKPLRISLKCDPQLAKLLREQYETVLPSTKLDKKIWNTILCTGQMSDDDLLDLARLSYRLVSES